MITVIRSSGAPTDWGAEWSSILLVFAVGLAATLLIVGLFALGIRFLAVGAPDVRLAPGDDPEAPGAVVAPRERPRPPAATVAALTCFGAVAGAVLYGIYLVIPLFPGA